jgi:peptide/nickel transport system substrate-binding protein
VQNFVPYPEVLGKFLRPGEAAARYVALTDWHRQRRHFWVGSGPFYLHSVHPVERSVVLRRFEDFPDASDKWLRFTKPEIPNLDLSGPMVVESGAAVEFDLRITYEGRPYPAQDIETAQFLVFGAAGQLAVKGQAQPAQDGAWRIALGANQVARLGRGANSLEVAVSSRRVALPAFASHAFATVPRASGAPHAAAQARATR